MLEGSIQRAYLVSIVNLYLGRSPCPCDSQTADTDLILVVLVTNSSWIFQRFIEEWYIPENKDLEKHGRASIVYRQIIFQAYLLLGF